MATYKSKLSEIKKYPEIETMISQGNFRESTLNNYLSNLCKYFEFQKMSPTELINEGIEDLNKHPAQQRVSGRFFRFMESIKESHAETTKNMFRASIKTFYKANFITIPLGISKERKVQIKIENKFDWKGGNSEHKGIIRQMITHSNARNKAIILLMSSSGLGRQEIINLTTEKFFEDIDIDNIATLRLRRQKTDVDFITFASPECVQAVREWVEVRKIEHQVYREKIVNKSGQDIGEDTCKCLFVARRDNSIKPIEKAAFSAIFRKISKKMGENYENGLFDFNKVRSHNLRKFFNSSLKNAGVDSDIVESFMAHDIGNTKAAYNFDDVDALKEIYRSNMSRLMVYTESIKILDNESSGEIQKLQSKITQQEEANKVLLEKMANLEMNEDAIFDRMMKRIESKGAIP